MNLMKSIKLAVGCINLIIPSFAPNLDFEYALISTGQIGPYQSGVEASFTTTLDFNLNGPHVMDFVFQVFHQGSYRTLQRERMDVSGKCKRGFLIKFPTNILSSSVKREFCLRIKDSHSERYYSTVKFEMQNEKSSTYDIASFKDGKYIGNKRALRIITNEVTYLNEEYDFSKISDKFYEPYYHRFNLKGLFLSSKTAINYDTIELELYDKNNVFPYLRKRGYFTYIPLRITKRPGDAFNYQFFFLNDMYVSKKTLEMSYLPKEGFVRTNYFYLPHNCANKLDGTTFKLKLNSLGELQNNFYKDMKYYFGQKLMGDCSSSRYCIVGEK